MTPIALRPVSETGTGPRHAAPTFLLIGPYDPKGGEYTFLAPPLGVWRLAGVLRRHGFAATVFDPNCTDGAPEAALADLLRVDPWTVIGVSTTGMTLAHDLALAHLARRLCPGACIVAGGMEATFNVERVLDLGPFDCVVLGEGEQPLIELGQRLQSGSNLAGIAGTARRLEDGRIDRCPGPAMTGEQLRDAIFETPYEDMPYGTYWARLEQAYGVGGLPVKAEREARLAEIRSVRLITLNYCPMGCTFCSSTNFLHAAQGGQTARIARLDEEGCLSMLKRIVRAHPRVRTVIFQDDIFAFTKDPRILALCQAILDAKAAGDLPAALQFISTNRIDAMTVERLHAMHAAGFRVLGFGIESFSPNVLREFNKAAIVPFISPMLEAALTLGITPFLDMILTSPRCDLADLAENIRGALRWIEAGCEVGVYPYVVPFSGAAMASDPALVPQTVYTRHEVAGTAIAWDQPSKILPAAADVRDAILTIERRVDHVLDRLETQCGHLPSRVRSLIWVTCAIPVLRERGMEMPDAGRAERALMQQLPARRYAKVRALLNPPMVRRAS